MSDAAPPPPATSPAAPQRPRPAAGRGRRALKWTLAAVLGAGALVAATPLLLSTGWANDVVRSWLADNVDRPVEFESLDVTWSDGVTIAGFVVHDEVAGQPPVLEAPQVILRAPLLPLLLQRMEVEEFVIVDPVVRIAPRGEKVSTAGVVKRKKAKRARPADAPDGAAGGAAPAEEPTVLPEIHVPVRVRNLTLVFADANGAEARRGGITFSGEVSTRGAPTTFDLLVPAGEGGDIAVKGTANLFDADGVVLPADRVRVDADLAVRRVDAAKNADLLALFLPGRPVAGVLDAQVNAVWEGSAGRGSLDVRLRDVAVDAAVGARPASAGDDLAVTGRWDFADGRVGLDDLKVRAEGLSVDGRLRGGLDGLDGRIDLDADLARMTTALRAFGVGVDGALAGRAKGGVSFTRQPSRGEGRLTLTGLRAEGFVAGAQPVTIDAAEVAFVVGLSDAGQTLESCTVTMPDLSAKVAGGRAKDGALDLRLEAEADLRGLLGRARDLGLVDSGVAVNGKLLADLRLRGRPGAEGAEAPSVAIDRLDVVEDDVRIEVRGGATAAGVLDVSASGSGDLGKLLGRAQAAGAPGPGLGAIRGRFDFQAKAQGAKESLVVTVPRFHLDGDLAVDVSGEWRAGGAVGGRLEAHGKIDDALALARSLGVLASDATFEGRIDATAVVGGTTAAPTVPEFKLSVAGPALRIDAAGAVSAERAVTATAKGEGDLARLADFATRAGFAQGLPPVRGRLTFDVEAAGTADELALPKFSASLCDGPASVDVSGSLAGTGRITGSATVDAALADLAAFAHEAGFVGKRLTPQGRMLFRGAFSGTTRRLRVPSADLQVTGPVELTARGSLDASDLVEARADFKGALQPVLDLAAQWTGGTARHVEGSFEGSIVAAGPKDKTTVTLPRMIVRAGDLGLQATATRTAEGDVAAQGALRGPLPALLNVLRAFGVAQEVDGTGTLESSFNADLKGTRLTGGATFAALDLLLSRPAIGSGGPFREPRAVVSLPSFAFDVETRRLEPVRALLQANGLQVEVTAEMPGGAPSAGADAPLVVDAKGKFSLEETFVRNHPELFGEVVVGRADGPYRFHGDVSRGLAAAGGWTGDVELNATDVTAPNVTVEKAHAVGKLAGGALVLEPVEGTVNGGQVTGRARIGLVGNPPEHSLDLTAKDVALATDLAPLVARASPLFAIGEKGKTGGAAAMDVHLTAKGLSGDEIKASLTGKGTLGLKDAFVESSDWIGTVLSLLGTSGRLDFSPVQVPFDVGGGRVRTGDVAMDAVGLLMRLGGEVGFDGKMEYGLRVKPKSGNDTFGRLGSLLDAEGFLPLRLQGSVSKPKLRAPDLKDALKGKLDDLLGGVLGGDRKDAKDDPKEKPPATPDDRKGGGRKKKDPAAPKSPSAPGTPGTTDEPPPPPPPPPRTQDPDEPPPPPPPARRD